MKKYAHISISLKQFWTNKKYKVWSGVDSWYDAKLLVAYYRNENVTPKITKLYLNGEGKSACLKTLTGDISKRYNNIISTTVQAI